MEKLKQTAGAFIKKLDFGDIFGIYVFGTVIGTLRSMKIPEDRKKRVRNLCIANAVLTTVNFALKFYTAYREENK